MLLNLPANWPAPKSVRALTTTRSNGCSLEPFSSNNLGLHVSDNAEHVLKNRNSVRENLSLPNEPTWLTQTHSNRCIIVENDITRQADAMITRDPNTVLAIMTADCLPILLCSRTGAEIAAIHAGWRGLLNGIIENTVQQLQSPRPSILAWIGPSICGQCFEVNANVRNQFLAKYPHATAVFTAKNSKWLFNFVALAEIILKMLCINEVYLSNACTFEDNLNFFSYRRQAQTGRMASLIWFNK